MEVSNIELKIISALNSDGSNKPFYTNKNGVLETSNRAYVDALFSLEEKVPNTFKIEFGRSVGKIQIADIKLFKELLKKIIY